MRTPICDQCTTDDACMIDFAAQTWCSRCWNTAAERSAQRGGLAPLCVNIPFVLVYCRRFAPTPQRPSPLPAAQDALRRRWAARLGLPLESRLMHPEEENSGGAFINP